MAWNASVTKKQVLDGVYHVTVRYTDGVESIDETYRSVAPTSTWIPDTVRDRIALLDKLSSFSITEGAVTPSAEKTVDTNEELFRRRCRLLETVKIMIDMGAVQADNAKVVALVNWVKNNAAAYFDSLDR